MMIEGRPVRPCGQWFFYTTGSGDLQNDVDIVLSVMINLSERQ